MTIEDLAVNTIKGLSMDAVEAAQSGHPGMPMGMADIATVLWTRFLKFNPDEPNWADRDRFVLSNGHGSMLLYSVLHLSGYPDMTLDQIKNFRQWGARTCGHPEYGEAPGIETTTGPLGQGISNAVGMALAERLMAGRFNDASNTLVDHHTYTFVGDGCLMEGVAAEAASLAGHWGLGKLIALYDDNEITIDGTTEISFSESVSQRFESYGWQVLKVDGHNRSEIGAAIEAAKSDTGRPSLICCRTHIGHGSPNKQDTSASHGAPLGADEIKLTKAGMNWPDEPFHIPAEVPGFFKQNADAGRAAYARWLEARDNAPAALVASHDDFLSHEISDSVWDKLPSFDVGSKIATRKASGAVLNAICEEIPQLIGGSADLAGSNNTTLKSYGHLSKDNFGADQRNIHYGVREHAMGAIMNGMALHGGFRPFGGTFLIFSDYMRPSIRLAALMHQAPIYVFTHDSVFLGEDGPTHQPVEQAMSLRLIPNSYVMRPADGVETAGAWKAALQRTDGPTSLLLTRQGLPNLEHSSHDGVAKGGYIVHQETQDLSLILLATGSEVHLAIEVAQKIGPSVRVISMPCWEIFDGQSDAYKDSVLPPSVSTRFAVEAGRSFGWEKYVGTHGTIHGIDRFGVSAPAGRIATEFGFTADTLLPIVENYLATASN